MDAVDRHPQPQDLARAHMAVSRFRQGYVFVEGLHKMRIASGGNSTSHSLLSFWRSYSAREVSTVMSRENSRRMASGVSATLSSLTGTQLGPGCAASRRSLA